jgi:proteasome accessory factor B
VAVPKLERLMNLVAALLHTPGPLSAESLRARVEGYEGPGEAFRRQFERDKDDLREMGVPIRVEPVPGSDPPIDGYRIVRAEYYLPDAGLKADELAALHLATRLVRIDDPGIPGGLWKLGGAAGVDASGELSDGGPLATLPSDPNLGALFEAAGSGAVVGYRYRGRERMLVPQVLGLQGGHWYVSGHDLEHDEQRLYRLDRIEGTVRSLGRPQGTVPVAADAIDPLLPWRIGGATDFVAHVLVDAVAAASVVEEVGADRVVRERLDGSVELELPVSNPEGFRSWVIGHGEPIEVLGPTEARNDLVAWLAAQAGERA